MGKRLNTTVWLDGRSYGPTEDVPADVAERITMPGVWVEDVDDVGADAEKRTEQARQEEQARERADAEDKAGPSKPARAGGTSARNRS